MMKTIMWIALGAILMFAYEHPRAVKTQLSTTLAAAERAAR